MKLSDEEKQNATTSESTTQSSVESKTAAPEEPSLTNVVTAAEDFIKVLATVSTSQSSSADAGKGETQTSEKKRKKNSSKKKKENKKKRGKGKGRKKNKKLDAVLKVDEGTTGAPPTGQTEEVMGKNNFAEGAARMNRFRIKDSNFMNSELDSEGNTNKMMRDDPQRTVNVNQDVVTVTASIKRDKEPGIVEHSQANGTELVSTSPTAHITPVVHDKTRAKLRQRAGKKRQKKPNPITEAKEETLSTRQSEGVSLLTPTPESPTAAVRNEASTIHAEEKGPTTQKTPIVRTKRPGSVKGEGRKRTRKVIASSTEETPRDISSQDPLLFTGSATVTQSDVLERLGLDRFEKPSESLRDSNARRNKGRRVVKICYEAVLPEAADTTPLTTLIEKDTESQLKDPEINTAPMFPLLQTNTPSSATRRPRNTKIKRHRERGNREKRGKAKRE
ncbi:proteoglycan 4 [Puntigrus tetrazona]|uniref:proteoglycan 4 n=1 Tax=Puntigrus tetrazona TaxID=1606681 RepID=UPI001C8A776A|nr:proteoglycan 4 [Puntigrus tetrazona]